MLSSQYLRTLDIFCDWGWEIDQALFAWFIQSHSFRWNKSIRSILNHYKSKNLFFLQKIGASATVLDAYEKYKIRNGRREMFCKVF